MKGHARFLSSGQCVARSLAGSAGRHSARQGCCSEYPCAKGGDLRLLKVLFWTNEIVGVSLRPNDIRELDEASCRNIECRHGGRHQAGTLARTYSQRTKSAGFLGVAKRAASAGVATGTCSIAKRCSLWRPG